MIHIMYCGKSAILLRGYIIEQFKAILRRLMKPSVIISIVSEITAILTLLHVDINIDAVTGITGAVCSVLVLLGILSNPDTNRRGFRDDIVFCNKCGCRTLHILVNGNLVCSDCGCVGDDPQNN